MGGGGMSLRPSRSSGMLGWPLFSDRLKTRGAGTRDC